jgi:glycosyltransferase involved in cell wall biosynthesis
MKALRILHIIPSISLAHGGPSRAIRMLEQSQRAAGMEVFTLTTDDDGPGRRLELSTQQDHRRHYARKWTDFYKIAPGMLLWLHHNARSYDIIHIHALFSFSSVAAAWIARLKGVPYVVRPLGTLAAYGIAKRRPWLKRLSLKLIEGPILRHAAAVHFTSEAEQQEADALGVPLRGVVIPLGVPTAQLPKRSENRAQTLLFLSRLDPKKNIECLLRAQVLLRDKGLKPKLKIAGSGRDDYVAMLRELASQLGIDDQVQWLGEVDGADKVVLWAESDLFVLPSFSENFGIAAAEALSAGLPCVLGRGVAVAARAADAGAALAVDPQPEAVAQALDRLLRDPAELERMSSRAQALAKQEYSVSAMVTRLSALYRRCMQSHVANRNS